jgi:CRISPR-associated protein Cas1
VPEVEEVPSLLPARMVNEAAYCSRLFFLEWVQARFTDNADTVDGRWKHRIVDQPTGRMPDPSDIDELREARSIMLSSERLGLVGRVDLLEQDAGTVVPVDYKRGKAPTNAERSWEPERVQLCVLGLLLRENGYRTDHGILWFADSRERVEIPFTEELVSRTTELTVSMRNLAKLETPPPPLIASPKCPRCSLVGICLPDEHNALALRSAKPPRRLVPSDSASRPLYVTEPGAVVGTRAGRIEVTGKKARLASVRPIDVSQVCVFGNVQVTTQALRDCFANDVPVVFFSTGGWLDGIASGLPSKHVELRRRQVALASGRGLEAAKGFVEGKIRNGRTLLRRNGRPTSVDELASLADLAEKARNTASMSSLLGFEGAAARTYFSAFPTMLRPDAGLPGEPFSFAGRNRRPPTDAVNCLLSFVYALIVKDLLAVCLAIGFDPYLGFYHRPRFGRPALALDLAEEFRALVGDSIVINVINNGEVNPNDFVVRGPGVALTSDGRKRVLNAYERRLDTELTHPTFGYKATYRRIYEVQARILAAWVLGELDRYIPVTTR